ncbi:hypothetical protein Hanom_Chr17g01548521 [Helianthus anomalus]
MMPMSLISWRHACNRCTNVPIITVDIEHKDKFKPLLRSILHQYHIKVHQCFALGDYILKGFMRPYTVCPF